LLIAALPHHDQLSALLSSLIRDLQALESCGFLPSGSIVPASASPTAEKSGLLKSAAFGEFLKEGRRAGPGNSPLIFFRLQA